MSTTSTEEVLAAALSLPPEARAHIAGTLLDSLDLERSEIDAAWGVEIEARIRDIDDGRTRPIPHEEVMAAARRHLQSMREK